MDRERDRDLKRSGSSGGRSSPAKRQQKALSGRISSSTKSISPLSSFPSEKVAVLSGSSYGGGRGGGGGEEESAMERWKKEKAKAFRWGSGINEEYSRTGDRGGINGSEEGEQHLSRPPLSRSAGLQSKVSEDCNAVGPAVVPRKLRSAMNKRSRLSASPPLPDSKNKLAASPPLPYPRNKCYASNGNLRPCVNGAMTYKRNMELNEPVTKDEEEAAETLSALASMIPDGRPVKISEDGRISVENSQTAATVVSHLEASKEVSIKILLPSTGPVATSPSSQIEESMAETAKPEPSALEQPTITSGNQELGPGSNGTAQPDFQRTYPSKHEQAKNAILRDSSNSSNLLEASLYSYCGNRSTQSNALSVHKPEIRPWPFGSASAEQVWSFKQKADNPTHYMCGKDPSQALQPGLPSSGNGHLAMSSSSKAALWPNSAATGCRTSSNGVSSNGTDLPTGKIPQVSADRRSSWKRCTTHVYISHIIQRYQKTEIKHQFLFLTNQSKAKGGTNSGVQESNEAIGISSLNSRTSAGISGSIMERTDESRIQMLSGSYMQQQQAPHHSIMPFPFSHGPSLHPDRHAAMTQQLQLPHHIGNSLYGPYGPQIVAAGGKLQQLWQAHMAQYRPSLGIPAWQTMRLQDPSLLPCAQHPSTFPQPSRELKVRSYQSPSSQQLQELLPIPSSSSSSSSSLRAKKPHGGGFRTEGACTSAAAAM